MCYDSVMVILGVDPGVARTGYAFLKKVGQGSSDRDFAAVDYGCITTKAAELTEQRLLQIHKQLAELTPKCSHFPQWKLKLINVF